MYKTDWIWLQLQHNKRCSEFSAVPAAFQPTVSILNLTTAIILITTFQTANLTGSNTSKTLLLALLIRLLNPHISLPFSDLCIGLRSTNALNINFFLLPTKFLQPVNLAILTTWSLFNLLAVPAPHLLSLFLVLEPSPWKSQIARLDMHHRLWNQLPDSFRQPNQSRLDSPPHSLVNPYLSSSPLSASATPSFFHSRLKIYLSTNPSHLNFSSLLIGLPSWSSDCTGLITLNSLFLVFLLHFFVPCGRLSWLPVSFLLHVKYTASHHIEVM